MSSGSEVKVKEEAVIFFLLFGYIILGFTGGSAGKNLSAIRRPRFDPWVGKIPWRRKWQPTAIFLLGKLHGQRSLAVCGPWGCKELDMTEQLSMHALPKNKSIHLFKKHTATLN